MKCLRILIPFVTLLFVTLSCSNIEDFNAGVSIQSCDLKCGARPFCQSSRGDMEKDEKANMQFPIGNVYPDVTGSQAAELKSRKSVNGTLTITVGGEGSVKVTIVTGDGSTIVETASKDDPVVITTDFQIKIKKWDEEKDSVEIVGIRVESVNGIAEQVQLEMVVNECIDDYCKSTSPDCK